MVNLANLSTHLAILRSVLNSASEGFIAVDSEGGVIEWSEKATRLFGWRDDEAVGRLVAELIIPEANRAHLSHALKRYLGSGQSEILGQWIKVATLHKDGRRMTVEVMINAVDASDETFFCVAVRDQLQFSLHENSPEQQAALLNLSRDSIVVCDLDYRLLFWNDGAWRLYGYTREEAIGRVAHDLLKSIYPKPLRDIQAELDRARHWEGEVFQQSRDGRPIAVLSR